MAWDIDITLINGGVSKLSQLSCKSRIADGHRSHVDAPMLLPQIHGYANNSDTLLHGVIYPLKWFHRLTMKS